MRQGTLPIMQKYLYFMNLKFYCQLFSTFATEPTHNRTSTVSNKPVKNDGKQLFQISTIQYQT